MVSSTLRLPFVWVACVALLLILRAIATFASPPWLWGLDSLADRSAAWWLFLIAFALPFSSSLMLKVGRLVSSVVDTSWILALSVVAALGALFTLFRSHNFLLGDSLLYVHALREGIQIESAGRREAGATIVVSALHWSLRKTLLTDSLVPFIVASVACGIAYVFLALVTSRLLTSKTEARALMFASLLAVGGLQIFFGHAEYYSLVAASGMLYIFFSLRWLKRAGSLVYPALALAGALFVHVMNAILAPSFLWLLFVAARRGRYRSAIAAAVVVPAVLGSAAALVDYPLESFLVIVSGGKHMLPLIDYDPDFYAYGLFSPSHLIEFLNVLLLTVPCLPLLALAAVERGPVLESSTGESDTAESLASEVAGSGEDAHSRTEGDEHGVDAPRTGGDAGSNAAREQDVAYVNGLGGFLALAATGAWLFAFLANPALGMARDWDIFAFPFIVVTLGASVAVARRVVGGSHVLWLCGAVTVIGCLHLALFVSNNRVPSAYVPRFRRVAMQENLFTPTPRAELWRYLGWEALKMDDKKQAREDLLRSVHDHPTQVKAYKMLAVIYIGERFDWLASPKGRARRRTLEIETQEEMNAEAAHLGLERYYTWAETAAPNRVRAYLGAGIAAMNVGAHDSLIVNAFKRAVEADPEDLEARAFWGDMLRSHGLLDEAEEQYLWVQTKRRWQERSVIGRACVLGARGEPEMAHIYVQELRDRYPWSVEAQQFLQAYRQGDLSDPEDFRTFIITQ